MAAAVLEALSGAGRVTLESVHRAHRAMGACVEPVGSDDARPCSGAEPSRASDRDQHRQRSRVLHRHVSVPTAPESTQQEPLTPEPVAFCRARRALLVCNVRARTE